MQNIIDIFEDMKLQVVVKTTTACEVLIRGRYAYDGQVKFFTETLTPSDLTGAANTYTPIQFPKGKLLNLDVSTPTANIQRGQLAISCGLLMQGQESTPFVRLMTGYVTSFKSIDLNSGYEDLLSGQGYISNTFVEPETAGSQQITVSSSVMLKFHNLTVAFIASAAVANRNVFVNCTRNDGNAILLFSQSAYNQTASQSKTYLLQSLGVIPTDLTDYKYITAVPASLFLLKHDVITIGAQLMDADDQIAYYNLIVEQWLLP